MRRGGISRSRRTRIELRSNPCHARPSPTTHDHPNFGRNCEWGVKLRDFSFIPRLNDCHSNHEVMNYDRGFIFQCRFFAGILYRFPRSISANASCSAPVESDFVRGCFSPSNRSVDWRLHEVIRAFFEPFIPRARDLARRHRGAESRIPLGSTATAARRRNPRLGVAHASEDQS